MSVSSIGGSGPPDFSAMATKMAAKMVKDLDNDGDGSLSKAEFTAGAASRGISATDAAKKFDSIDIKGTGSVTASDIETDMKANSAQAGAAGGKGAPPAGGGKGPPPSGGAGKSGGASGSASSSSSAATDPKDTNGDGTVSASEELLYEIAHPDLTKSSSSYDASGKSAEKKNTDSSVDLTA